MADSMQYHHVTLKPKADRLEETRKLLLQCAVQVLAHKPKGPLTWCASFDEENQVFLVEALFPNQEAVAFHQNNIKAQLRAFSTCMAAPPETVQHEVFLSVRGSSRPASLSTN